MKHGYLSKQDILLCRRVSKPMKEAVDEQLSANRPRWLREKTWLRWGVNAENFLARAPEFIIDGQVSTLLSRNVQLNVWDDENLFSRAMVFLKLHGKWIRKLQFVINPNEDIPQPRVWIEMLIECLNQVPSLQSLNFDVEGWNGDEASLEQWKNYVPPTVAQFPPLTSLTELGSIRNEDNFDLPPPRKFFQPIVDAYGSQLLKLTLDPFLFSDNDCLDIVTENVANLRVLEIEGTDDVENVLPVLSQLNLPHLEVIKFDVNDLEINEAFLSALIPFQSNLKELDLRLILGVSDDGLKNISLYFPKLEQLTIDTYCLEIFRDVWNFLKAVGFPSLEKIRVRRFWSDIEFPGDDDIGKMEDFFVEGDEEGKANERYTPFSVFPNLKVFQWERSFNDLK